MKLIFSYTLLNILILGCLCQTKYILITGSSDGIGRETARQLARNDTRGNFIILHGRNDSRCANVSDWLRREVPGVQLGCVVGDFLNLREVEALGDTINNQYSRLNVVLLNAGIFPNRRLLTQQGLEETFQINHLAHFLLIHKLADTLRRNAASRIVVTSSVAHTWVTANWDDFHSNKTAWDPYQVYGRSKLYNVMMTDVLASRLRRDQVTANSLHPGWWQTKLSRWTGSPVEGVRTPAYLATSREVEGVTGEYYTPQQQLGYKSSIAENQANQNRLWRYSEDLLRRFGFNLPRI